MCEFELKDDSIAPLLHKLEVIFRLCDRNPLYYIEHNFKIGDETNSLYIKLYKND
jgi:hypothetical protein